MQQRRQSIKGVPKNLTIIFFSKLNAFEKSSNPRKTAFCRFRGIFHRLPTQDNLLIINYFQFPDSCY